MLGTLFFSSTCVDIEINIIFILYNANVRFCFATIYEFIQRFDLLPEPSPGTTIPQSEITRQLRHEVNLEADAQRQFYQYAKVWWKEYLEIDASFKVCESIDL